MAAKKSKQKELRDQLMADAQKSQKAPPDPLSAQSLKSMGLRMGIPVLIAWILAFVFDGWIQSRVLRTSNAERNLILKDIGDVIVVCNFRDRTWDKYRIGLPTWCLTRLVRAYPGG